MLVGPAHRRTPGLLDLATTSPFEEVCRGASARTVEVRVAKSKQNQQTGKTVLEKRRAKKAKREVVARQRKRTDAVRSAPLS